MSFLVVKVVALGCVGDGGMEDLGDQVGCTPDPIEDVLFFKASDYFGVSRAPGGNLGRP